MTVDSSPVRKVKAGKVIEPAPVVPFKDRYNIKKVICKGGQANVHKAYDKKSCTDVAIKVYKK